METITKTEQTRRGVFLNEVKNAKELNLIQPGQGMNEWLIAGYKKQTGANDFRTFKKWKESGKSVKKGEKGFPIFSRPIGIIQAENGKNPSDEMMRKFGVCYLFNENQVK